MSSPRPTTMTASRYSAGAIVAVRQPSGDANSMNPPYTNSARAATRPAGVTPASCMARATVAVPPMATTASSRSRMRTRRTLTDSICASPRAHPHPTAIGTASARKEAAAMVAPAGLGVVEIADAGSAKVASVATLTKISVDDPRTRSQRLTAPRR